MMALGVPWAPAFRSRTPRCSRIGFAIDGTSGSRAERFPLDTAKNANGSDWWPARPLPKSARTWRDLAADHVGQRRRRAAMADAGHLELGAIEEQRHDEIAGAARPPPPP
jgi:hypothetical protein